MQTPDSFQLILIRLLEDDAQFKQKDWARILGVTHQDISQWISGDAIPSPNTLRGIIRLYSDLPKSDQKLNSIINDFWQLAALPIEQVAPNSFTLFQCPTLSDYIVQPQLEHLRRLLITLPPKQKETIVRQAIKACIDCF